MKKKELAELLEDFDDDDEVMFTYPAGDYWRNIIASPINCVDYGTVKYSDYHTNFTLIKEDEISEPLYEDDVKNKKVVVIS